MSSSLRWWLLAGMAVAAVVVGFVLLRKRSNNPLYPIVPCPTNYWTQQNSVGDSGQTSQAASECACRLACNSDSTCVGYSFAKSGGDAGDCLTWSDPNQTLTYNTDYNTGLKR